MAPRNVAWCAPELQNLVRLVGEKMPATEEEWEEVMELHNVAFPSNRTITALQNKFKDLYRTKMPTGDPKIPDYIKRAKEIHQDFIERTDGSVGAADDDDVDDNTSNINGKDVEEENDEELENYFDAAQLFIPPQPDLELNTPRPMS